MSTRKLARCGLVAALYVVLCMALQPLSFGAVQIRFAEALVLLPVFGAEYIAAAVLGCFLSNLLGSVLPDVIFVRMRGLALPAAVPPVLFNALIVGPEIAIFFSDTPATLPLMVWNGVTVALGEVVACGVLGVALVKLIESNPALRKLFTE